MAHVKWSNDALSDLDAISEYISQDSPVNAKKFVQEIFQKVEDLSKFPHMGRVVPDQDNEHLREILHGYYRIIYEVKNGNVEILIVIHGSRMLRL